MLKQIVRFGAMIAPTTFNQRDCARKCAAVAVDDALGKFLGRCIHVARNMARRFAAVQMPFANPNATSDFRR